MGYTYGMKFDLKLCASPAIPDQVYLYFILHHNDWCTNINVWYFFKADKQILFKI